MIDKSEYMNRSELSQIDQLVESVYKVFQTLSTTIKELYDNREIDLESKDKVGFIISSNEQDFITAKPKEKKVEEQFDSFKEKAKSARPSDKSNSLAAPPTTSMQTTSLMSSNSKALSLNENLARDYNIRNIIKHKVIAKWLPNEQSKE